MTEEGKYILGCAIDAAAKAMRTNDPPLPLHIVEAVVAETINQVTQIIMKTIHTDDRVG